MTSPRWPAARTLRLNAVRTGLVWVIGACLSLTPASAQLAVLQMEANVGGAVPLEEFAGMEGWEREATAGSSFGVHFALKRGRFNYLVGFSEHRFQCPAVGCGAETDLVSTAWDIGLRLNLRSSGVVPWIQLGTIAALVQADLVDEGAPDPSVSVRRESDRSWGFEAGAGFLVPMATRFGFNPSVRYGQVDVDFEQRGALRERYLVVDLGFVLGF